jgi:hypothetical protein
MTRIFLLSLLTLVFACNSETGKKTAIRDSDYWNNLIDSIDFADFWGLKEDNGRHGMDVSFTKKTIQLSGLTK